MLPCWTVTWLQGLFHTSWRSLWLDISKGFISRNQVCSRKDPVLEREEALLQSRSYTFSRQKKSKVIIALDEPRSQATDTGLSERDRSSSIFLCSLAIPTSPPPRKTYKSHVFRLGMSTNIAKHTFPESLENSSKYLVFTFLGSVIYKLRILRTSKL